MTGEAKTVEAKTDQQVQSGDGAARCPDWAIRRMLEISTGHVCLDGEALLENPNQPHLIVYKKGDYGWLILVPEESDLAALAGNIPKSVHDVLCYARRLNCQWVMLDCDAYELPDLPLYDW